MNNPCYHCPNRHTACHDTCEKYKAWHEFHLAAAAHDKEANARCTIHKGDFDEDAWHGKRRRRHK